MKRYIKIHENDNVIVALKEIDKGETVLADGVEVKTLERIPAGHKMALEWIRKGSEVIKYGTCIGNADEDIKAGQWVHTHNVKTALDDFLTYNYQPAEQEEARTDKLWEAEVESTFLGYRRRNGKVGIRNEVWIIPTVGCVNAVGEAMAREANKRHGAARVIAFQHPYGCSQMGEDQESTRTILADLTGHPNAGGVLVLGLGCENSSIEVFGAETFLMNRCENQELFGKTVDLINDFKQYYKENHQEIYENPSPGNKAGGITTLEDKSLGCIQKSGSTAVRGVLSYGQTVTARGLNLLSAPGNDLVASTALAASGAHIVLFTTGRGTPFASPVPTVKISSNRQLAGKKKNWIDFDAGMLAEDGELEDMAKKLYHYVMEVASGKQVCSEKAGFHDMAIFKRGVTL